MSSLALWPGCRRTGVRPWIAARPVEEAVQDWLGAQWAEHNRGAPMPSPDGEPGGGAVERLWPMVNKPTLFRRRRKR